MGSRPRGKAAGNSIAAPVLAASTIASVTHRLFRPSRADPEFGFAAKDCTVMLQAVQNARLQIERLNAGLSLMKVP